MRNSRSKLTVVSGVAHIATAIGIASTTTRTCTTRRTFTAQEYYQSSNDLYNRYPQEMRIPVYNKQWHNPYPEGRLYHSGHHFILDTF